MKTTLAVTPSAKTLPKPAKNLHTFSVTQTHGNQNYGAAVSRQRPQLLYYYVIILLDYYIIKLLYYYMATGQNSCSANLIFASTIPLPFRYHSGAVPPARRVIGICNFTFPLWWRIAPSPAHPTPLPTPPRWISCSGGF